MDIDDHPGTILEFEEYFATEEACRRYLFQLWWWEGFVARDAAIGKQGRPRGGFIVAVIAIIRSR